MGHVNPKDVRSPRESWNLIDVLYDGGPGPDAYALAIGDWEGNRRVAIRWNGTDDKPAGNPQSRGIATWFVLPPDFNDIIVGTLKEPKVTIAKALLGT